MHHQSQRYEIRATARGPAIAQDFWPLRFLANHTAFS